MDPSREMNGADVLLPSTDGGLAPLEQSELEALQAASFNEPINILLVDDEPKNLTVLETILENPGYRLVRAESADEALLALVNEEFALIVLDIQMPKMSGFELAQMIKQRKRTATIPIIFLTAHFGEDQHILEGYETGAVDYLHKPINSVILRSKVAVFADLHRKTRDSQRSQQHLLAEVTERRRVQEELRQLNQELEQRVEMRTSELSRANAALSESEERLRRAQQAGQVGIWEWDFRTGLGIWSDAARSVFHLPETDEKISFETGLSHVHPDDRSRVMAKLNEARSADSYRDEFRIVDDAGIAKWVELVGGVEFQGAEPVRMRGAVRNITERKEIELELKESNRRKDQFLAMLGHELRNPLAPIRNAVSILEMISESNSEMNWCRDVLDRQVKQMTRLVDDLLDVSRVSRGKIQLQREVLDLRVAVQQAIESCRPLIDTRRHRLTISLSPTPIYVDCDLARISQVIANLLNNAAKYTDEGGEIGLTLDVVDGPTKEARVRVTDNGRGISADVINHLFELFFQADHNLDRSDGGLGIGLSLVRSIVEMHGGRVEVRSPGPGRGSEFCILLPSCSPPVTEKGPNDVNKPAPGNGMRMLVVDDNRDAAKSMSMVLSIRGYDVTMAFDGKEAVEKALHERPGVILLDIGLPLLNGYEACQRMRQNGLTDQLIIAVTGYGQEDDRRLSGEAGFDYHLVKPVDINALEKLLREHVMVK